MSDPSTFPSPMGRYDLGETQPGGRRYQIRMVGVPVELFLATREQHDALMREFTVLALAHQDEERSRPPEMRLLVRELGFHYAASGSGADESVEAASRAGQVTIDLSYHVLISVLTAADQLERLMRSADAYCREGRMLTMPRTPEMVRFSEWWLGELRRQIAGYPPTHLTAT
ncbi:MAG TPA: hypothetical protein VHX15_09480 [Frankiaceae bacterium]|jgi:hypothetical protein|nr:hypothetical protein [Frankiaceae bacterium]